MKFEFFSIPACSPEQGQEELNSFCSSHRIASIEKQFVANGEQSYWAICVSYLDGQKKITPPGKIKVDYREILEEREFAVFAKLRSLRKTMAEKEGVPAYALFTNEQLADTMQQKENDPRYASRIERMPPKAYRGLCLRRPGAFFEKTAPGPGKNFYL
jgi:superfamily II DNA helicase RecQ